MGYSCSAAAQERLDMIMEQQQGQGPIIEQSNTWNNNQNVQYFYEIGRENADGAITGSIYKMVRNGCVRSGSFRIEASSKVTRFPNMNAAMKRAAYGPIKSTPTAVFHLI